MFREKLKVDTDVLTSKLPIITNHISDASDATGIVSFEVKLVSGGPS